jgi:hypothetical protein
MYIKIFNLDNIDDCSLFKKIWQSSQFRRPHDHPAFLELMASTGYNPKALVVFKHQKPIGFYCFYSLKLCEMDPSWSNLSYRHAISAYGYGGLTTSIKDKHIDWKEPSLLINNYFREQKYVSEFVRQDLFDQAPEFSRGGGCKFQQNNIVVNLCQDKEALFSNYKHSVRKNIKRAVSSGLTVEFDFSSKSLDNFLFLYNKTMDRKGATKQFYFDRRSFENFIGEGSEDRIFSFVTVKYREKIIAVELILLSCEYIYSFLGGLDFEFRDKRPADFLKHSVSKWGIENNYKKYILGGGFTADDGIYKFKKAFSRDGIYSFNTFNRVIDQDGYDKLIELRSRRDPQWQPTENFFPKYF